MKKLQSLNSFFTILVFLIISITSRLSYKIDIIEKIVFGGAVFNLIFAYYILKRIKQSDSIIKNVIFLVLRILANISFLIYVFYD
jgi:hypothetical protein